MTWDFRLYSDVCTIICLLCLNDNVDNIASIGLSNIVIDQDTHRETVLKMMLT